MQIDLRQVPTNYEGKSIQEPVDPRKPEGETKDASLRSIFSTALNTLMPDETLGAEEKAKIYALSNKLFGKQHDPSFSLDERALIKERAGKVFGPMVYGRVCDILDPPANEDEPAEEPEVA